jgi:purine-nucleoside phosphorylase
MKKSDEIMTPGQFIDYLRVTLTLKPTEIRLPSRGIMVFGSEDFEAFRRATHGRQASWSPSQCVGRAGRSRVFVGRSHIGAPAAAIQLEEMAVRGVRDCISFGACGSLLKDLPIGSVVLPTFAYPDEGTSRHYGAPRRPTPSPSLVAALRTACRNLGLSYRAGGVWTSDAPYRETRTMARRMAHTGAVAVEMEAAALYAVARYRRLRTASLMVVSDELEGEGWMPGFRSPAFLRAKRTARRAVVAALTKVRR